MLLFFCDLCVLWCNRRGGTWDVIVALQNNNQQVLGVQGKKPHYN